MRKSVTTKALYAGSFDPVTRGHLDIIGKALLTFDTVHVAIGANVRKARMFGVEESQQLLVRSIAELWPQDAPPRRTCCSKALWRWANTPARA